MCLKREQSEAICYTVEREFLAKFSAKELIERIIKIHLQNKKIQEPA